MIAQMTYKRAEKDGKGFCVLWGEQLKTHCSGHEDSCYSCSTGNDLC